MAGARARLLKYYTRHNAAFGRKGEVGGAREVNPNINPPLCSFVATFFLGKRKLSIPHESAQKIA